MADAAQAQTVDLTTSDDPPAGQPDNDQGLAALEQQLEDVEDELQDVSTRAVLLHAVPTA